MNKDHGMPKPKGHGEIQINMAKNNYIRNILQSTLNNAYNINFITFDYKQNLKINCKWFLPAKIIRKIDAFTHLASYHTHDNCTCVTRILVRGVFLKKKRN